MDTFKQETIKEWPIDRHRKWELYTVTYYMVHEKGPTGSFLQTQYGKREDALRDFDERVQNTKDDRLFT